MLSSRSIWQIAEWPCKSKAKSCQDLHFEGCKCNCKYLCYFLSDSLSADILFWFSDSHIFMFIMQLLEMVEQNELNMSLVTLLDENIASAHRSNQVSNSSLCYFRLQSYIYLISEFTYSVMLLCTSSIYNNARLDGLFVIILPRIEHSALYGCIWVWLNAESLPSLFCAQTFNLLLLVRVSKVQITGIKSCRCVNQSLFGLKENFSQKIDFLWIACLGETKL